MRYIATLAVFAVILFGCAHAGRNPVVPVAPGGDQIEPTDLAALAVDRDGPHRLLGSWTFYIDSAHERVDVVPRRDPHFHLNGLRFLEEYCKNCLQITSILNNGDGTIDLTVRITHPFKGFPQYTGFDVKGIIMFNGSYEYPNSGFYKELPKPIFRVSWRERGDPEVLNPDGYVIRWSPQWQSGSTAPIFNYWEGRFARGVPNADLNAYLNFYSHEERHMFASDASVSRTCHIWLPPGPVVAGYAVEACWEPPTVTPVTNPLEDFPLSANQGEAYHFKFVVNNGEVITECEGCCGSSDCSDLYVEHAQWGGMRSDRALICWPDAGGLENYLEECKPAQEGRYQWAGLPSCKWGNGTHRLVAANCWVGLDNKDYDLAYTVFDITVNDPDLQ
jgi:hypothetical protein